MIKIKMKNYFRKLALILSITVIIISCDRDINIDTPEEMLSVSDPDQFSLFLNPQYGFSAVQYKVVAATEAVGESGGYNLLVQNNGETILKTSGSWSSSGGQDALSVNNVSYDIKVKQTGGIKITLQSSSANTYLYLLDAAGNILMEDDDSGDGTNSLIDQPDQIWNSQKIADAYYSVIDPADERLTLNAWKTKNGFGSGTGTELTVAFRDTKDLGYGRMMYVRQNPDNSLAMYVENYQFAGVDGLQYGRLNLDALINSDQRHHFGSNAIEWSPPEGGGAMFAKFYTFKADTNDASVDEARISTVDLDGRGNKAMPGVCIVCHGGDNHAMEDNGEFSNAGNTHSKLQILEPDTFDFAELAGFTRADQEATIKQINEMILSTYPTVQVEGEWNSAFAIELVEGWYGGSGLPEAEFDGEYVPVGWRPDPDTGSPPAGADELFLKVVKPSCLVCHSKRGTDLRADINFSTYNDFIAYAEKIEEYVYEAGIMPLALLPYNNFWNSTNPYQPELLATHLPDFSHANADGSIDPPGKPVASPGPDRVVNGAITLSAEASLFYQSVSWEILSQPSATSNGIIDNTTALRPTFTADEDGDYEIQLTVSNDQNVTASEIVIVTIDSTAPVTRDLTFENDIKPIIQGVALPVTSCITCHTDDPLVATAVPGIPVLYTDSAELYHHVLERVNLKYIERSRFLQKPTGHHHFGGLQPGYDITGDSTHFNTVLNWISEGAREQ